AITPDKQRFVLGTEWSLRAYDMAVATKAPRAWLGVKWKDIDEAAAATSGLTEARGALIVAVITPSPADKAGLKEGDVILGINNWPAANGEELRRQLSGFSPNHKIDLKIWRARQKPTISVNLSAQPISPMWWRSAPSVVWGVNIAKDGKLIVAAYGDGTIRWHRLSDGQELLALFVHAKDRRWVAWTPKGYYTASAGGENLIGWHVNRGWTGAADCFPAHRFRNRFYRPDVVHQVLQAMDEDKAMAEADRLDNTARQERDILKLLPPVVEILSPKDGDGFADREVTIEYSARSTAGQKVDDVEIYLDNQKINKVNNRGLIPVAPSDSNAQSLVLSLPRRNVTITLVARSGDKSSEPRSIELRWSGTRPEAKPQPRLLALLIGVSTYNQQSLKLDFAHQDALNLAEALKAQEGKAFLKVETNVLLNADSASIRKGFDWLNTNAQDGDLTLILLSGHGTTRSNTFYF